VRDSRGRRKLAVEDFDSKVARDRDGGGEKERTGHQIAIGKRTQKKPARTRTEGDLKVGESQGTPSRSLTNTKVPIKVRWDNAEKNTGEKPEK